MHNWGDKNVDWEGISDCCDILYKICTKYGRLGGQIKEKYSIIGRKVLKLLSEKYLESDQTDFH